MAEAAGEGDPLSRVMSRDSRLESRQQGSVADDHHLQVRHALAGDCGRLDQFVLPLHRCQAPDAHDQWHGAALTPGLEPGVDTVVDRYHAIGAEAEAEKVIAGGVRRRQREGSPVERWRKPGLHGAADTGEWFGQQLIPHRTMHMMEEGDVRLSAPDRAHPRHAVPDLDERVVGTHSSHPLAAHRAWEHRIATAAAHDAIPVANRCRRLPEGRRGAMRDVQPRRRPSSHEFVGMHFRAAGVGIVEVAPGEHVHAAHTDGHHLVGELLDRRNIGVSQGAGVSTRGRAGDGAR